MQLMQVPLVGTHKFRDSRNREKLKKKLKKTVRNMFLNQIKHINVDDSRNTHEVL